MPQHLYRITQTYADEPDQNSAVRLTVDENDGWAWEWARKLADQADLLDVPFHLVLTVGLLRVEITQCEETGDEPL